MEQGQTDKSYVKISYKQYIIEFSLEQNYFQVKIINDVTLQQYFQTLTQEYIISRQDFKNLFQTPEDLFCYLVSNQDMITFNKEGQLSFQIKLVGKQKKSRVQMINIAKKQQTQAQLIILRHQKLRKQFSEYVQQKEIQVGFLKNNVNQLQQTLSFYCEKMARVRLNTHEESSDKDNLILYYQKNSLKVKFREKQEEQNCTNFINCYPIIAKTKQIYHTTLLQGNYEMIAIGFVTRQIFDEQQVRGSDRIFLREMQIFNDGDSQYHDIQFIKDDVISCSIQMSQQKSQIQWIRNGVKFAQSTLSENLKVKAMYFCIIFYDKSTKFSIKVQDIRI